MDQLLHAPLHVLRVGKHRVLRLVLDAVPQDHVLPAGGGRPADREQQPPVERDLQVAQDLPAQDAVRQEAGAGEAHREEGPTRVGMFLVLDAGSDATGGEIELLDLDQSHIRLWRTYLYVIWIVFWPSWPGRLLGMTIQDMVPGG